MGENCGVWKFGVPWTEEEFINVAMMAKHPFDAPPSLPDDLVRSMFDITVQGPVQFQQNVHQATEYWQRREAKLAVQEQVLHKHMPLHRRKVLLGKKLLLFKEIMESVRKSQRTTSASKS